MLHPQTRWLSLEAVVHRVLSKYEALKIYFQVMSSSDISGKATSILNQLKNPIYILFLQFLDYILPIVNRINRLFQSESP